MSSSMFQMRQIKLRSLEDAVYTTQYNRVRFDIQPDDMSTDLSQSYLLIRLFLASVPTSGSPSVPYTTAEIQSWIAQNVMVSFGYEEQSYSPACMIKTARLVNKKTGSVVEEIQFANVLNQYLFQMTNDKETLSSQNLLTGTALEIGKGSGITQSYSAFLQNPTSIRILLKDIFGCCNTSNFYLSETGGMELSFELEDRLPLLRTSVMSEPERIAFAGQVSPALTQQYPTGTDLSADYDQYPDTMGANTNTTYDKVFKDNTSTNGLYSQVINAPRAGFKYLAEYFEPLGPAQWIAANNVPIDTLTLSTIGAADNTSRIAAGLGLAAGFTIKLNFTWAELTPTQIADVNGGVGVEPKMLEFITTIASLDSSSGGAGPACVLTLADKINYPVAWCIPNAPTAPTLTSVEVMPVTFAYLAEEAAQIAGDTEDLQSLLSKNKLHLQLADLIALEKLGIVALTSGTLAAPTGYKTTNVSVEIGLQGNDTDEDIPTLIYPDQLRNQNTSFSTLSSNLLVRLPYQGRGVRVKSITPIIINESAAYAYWEVEFSDLGVNLENGWDLKVFTEVSSLGQALYPPQLLFGETDNYYVLFFNAMAAGSLPNTTTGLFPLSRVNPFSSTYSSPIPLTLTYNVDRFEIVLIQQTKNPKMPMSMGCSTFKVEPQNIQYPQYQWSQQFSVTEPNCYNAILLTPDYLAPAQQLVSTRRNISRFRNSLNNIDFANRDTQLSSNESDYPSSLYSDQLIDYFSNSQYPQRSLYGLREIAHSREPIIAVPMKIYNAFANGQMVGNGGMPYTLQVNLYGDPAMASGGDPVQNAGTIKVGPVFLFKQCLKSWNE